MMGVESVAVRGEKNPLLGQVVVALITVIGDERPLEFRRRMEAFTRAKLPGYMIPQKVVLTRTALHGERFKKMRNQTVEGVTA
jgi:long-chain acyl-CoA synthetase